MRSFGPGMEWWTGTLFLCLGCRNSQARYSVRKRARELESAGESDGA
jgi:hypothetical protein